MRILCAVAASLVLIAPSIAGAQLGKEPRRPKLATDADTNDARAYYDFAIGQLTRDAQLSADALYWATRIEPMWADAYYARRVALLIVDPTRAFRYTSGDRRAIAEAKAIDSLLYRALTINPFVPQRLNRRLYDAILDEVALRAAGGRVNSGAVRHQFDLMAQNLPPAQRAEIAYGDSLFDQALVLYSQAIEKNQKSISLRVDRARLLFEMNRFEGALIDLTGAMEELRKIEQKDLVFFYQSRAIIEHRIAVVHQKLGDVAAAKEAFGRALREDLSYYPAHFQLAVIALGEGDTTTALTEMDLATQLREDDAGAQYLYGFTLVRVGKVGEGEPHIKKAIQLNPTYAAPKFLHARLLEAADYREEAIAAYKAFLAAATRTDPRRAEAETHLAALSVPHDRD